MIRNVRAALAMLAMLSFGSTSAHADSKADALFKQGKKLLAQKKYAEACEAFEQSDGLDTGIGTKLNVARCYEEWGKLASALRWYKDAEQMAADHKDPRIDKIKTLEEAIDGDVPRLTIKANDNADVSVLTLDGATVKVNEPLPVDPGPHELLWTTSDGKKKSKVVPLERGGSSEVKVDLPKKKKGKWGKKHPAGEKPGKGGEATGGEEEPDKPSGPEGDGRTQRLVGVGVAGAGVISVGIAAVVTIKARSKYNDAIDAHCSGDRTMCDDAGLATTADARHRANVMTVVALVGGAAIVGGVVLYLVAPHGSGTTKTEHALYLAPEVNGDGGAIVLGGRF